MKLDLTFWLALFIFGWILVYIFPVSARRLKTVKRVLLWALGIGILCVIWLILLRLLPAELEEIAQEAGLRLFLSATFIVMSLHILYIRWQSRQDRLLLDMGKGDASTGGALLGVLSLGLSLVSAWDAFQSPLHPVEDSAEAVYYASQAIFLILTGSGKMICTEQGLFTQTWAVKWQDIRSYTWEEYRPPRLELKIRRLLPFLNTRSLKIPAQHREQVQALLTNHVMIEPE